MMKENNNTNTENLAEAELKNVSGGLFAPILDIPRKMEELKSGANSMNEHSLLSQDQSDSTHGPIKR